MYIPDLTERYPEGFNGVDMYAPRDLEYEAWEAMERDYQEAHDKWLQEAPQRAEYRDKVKKYIETCWKENKPVNGKCTIFDILFIIKGNCIYERYYTVSYVVEDGKHKKLKKERWKEIKIDSCDKEKYFENLFRVLRIDENF